MGLSKGTLGLKFMNRQAPVAVSPSPAAAANPPSSSSASSTTASRSQKDAGRPTQPTTATASNTPTSRAAAQEVLHSKAVDRHGQMNKASIVASRPAVVHETSLLSFPLLSTLNRSASAVAGPSASSMTATYSSMPLTSAMVSGRRSFGGANIEIEKLNDPSSHQTPPEGAADATKSKSAKRPKKADRDAALVGSVRETKRPSARGGLSGSGGVGKRTADSDRRIEEVGGGDDAAGKKKRRKTDENGVTPRWEVDDDDGQVSSKSGVRQAARGGARSAASPAVVGGPKAEFARPAGFDGVLKKPSKPAAGPPSASNSSSKGKSRVSASDLMDDEQYRWAKPGETREWDAGKSSEDGDDGGDDDDDGDSEEEEEDSSDDDEEDMVSGSDDEEEAILADEKRFSEAADRAVGGGGKGGRPLGPKSTPRGGAKGGQRRR